MDTKQFLNEFGHIANASNGINKLRELILGLAITGRLIEAEKSNLTASSLVEKIKAHRAELISIGELRRPKPLPEISNQEIPFSVPQNWIFERLGSICDIVRGITFPASRKESVKSDGNVVCLRTANVQADVDWTNLIYVDPSFVKRKEQWIKSGDTIISMANSYELVGKVSLVKKVEQKATFGGFVSAIRPHLLNPEYLYLFLRSPYMQNKMRSTASQTTNIANISLAGLQPIPVPIPPLEEQAKIVSKVNDLMELCDKLDKQQQDKRKLQNQFRQATLQAISTATSPFELKQHWQRLDANFSQLFSFPEDLDEFSAHIKELAVQGRLTVGKKHRADIDNIKSACNKLKDTYILKKLMRQQKLVSIAEYSVDYPENWEVLAFDKIAIVIGGVTKGRKLQGRELMSCPYLAVANVQRGFFKLTNIKTIDIPVDELEKYSVQQNDLLITEGGDWDKVGRTAIWKEKIENCIHQNHVFKARVPSKGVLNRWVELVFNSNVGRDYFAGASKQTTNLASINMTQLRSFPFPIPPIEQQEEILTVVEGLEKLCNSWRNKYKRLNELSSLLANTAVGTLTGMSALKEEESLKTPITELVAPISIGTSKPSNKDAAPLATLLVKQDGNMNANDLWQRFGGEIDKFYAQLKTEIKHGWIAEPVKADMLEKDPE
ncbi:restriction endonuclease subunit S [Alteromonas marina]